MLPPLRRQGRVGEGCSLIRYRHKSTPSRPPPATHGEEESRPLPPDALRRVLQQDAFIGELLADCIGASEVAQLAAQGVREVNLLGQNVNAYRGKMHDGSIADLALLITYVAAIDGIDRIRFTTSHPNEFGDNLIQAYADVPELVSHLHLPVQSGSDRILAAMKRKIFIWAPDTPIKTIRRKVKGRLTSTNRINRGQGRRCARQC